MIIKSHIRGGYRSAAAYLKAQGENEKIRTVEISDPDAKTLDQAFQNMWEIARNSKAKKPLHHISINPMKGETLIDEQVLKIVERCEQKYGYKPGDHQRVIVEHIKDGRQHFHVMWNRVSLTTGKVVKSGEHWKKSKQAAREMEKELGLNRPALRRMQKAKVVTSMPKATGKIQIGRNYAGHKPVRPTASTTIQARKPVSTLGFSIGIGTAQTGKAPSAPQQPQLPHQPIGGGKPSGMSEAQWLDFIAACEGKITWRQYFQKWGGNIFAI